MKKYNKIIGIITIGLAGIVLIIVEPAFTFFSVGFSGIFILILASKR